MNFSPSVILPKCCNLGSVFHEATSLCEPGIFKMDDIKVYDTDLIHEVNASLHLDPGALSEADCQNGTRR